MQILLEICAVKDSISGRFRVVNDEFMLGGSRFVARCSFGGLHKNRKKDVGIGLLRRELSKATNHREEGRSWRS